MEISKFIIPKTTAYKYLPVITALLPIGNIPYSFSPLFFSVIENGSPLKDTPKNMIKKINIMGCVKSPSNIDIK
jgi:hypothetical protein